MKRKNEKLDTILTNSIEEHQLSLFALDKLMEGFRSTYSKMSSEDRQRIDRAYIEKKKCINHTLKTLIELKETYCNETS